MNITKYIGVFTVALLLAACGGGGSSSSGGGSTATTVGGTWSGPVSGACDGSWIATLSQSGTSVSGTSTSTFTSGGCIGSTSTLSGSLTDNLLSMNDTDGAVYSLTVNAEFTSMSGTIVQDGIGFTTTITKQ